VTGLLTELTVVGTRFSLAAVILIVRRPLLSLAAERNLDAQRAPEGLRPA
jgi:hypothetical protein